MTAAFHPASPAATSSAGLLSIEQAHQAIAQLLNPLGSVTGIEQLALLDAQGRVLAQDIISPVNVPPHDNSAMDGYAFTGAQLASAPADQPLLLQVLGTVVAGKPWAGGLLQSGQCLKIMTGAVMPAGADTVVPYERVNVLSDTEIEITPQSIKAGANCRLAGEDLRAGAIALPAGVILNAASLGLIASLGMPTAPVRRKLRVAYFSTGDEILAPGSKAREGAIFDSNRYSLMALLKQLGAEVQDLGGVADDALQLQQKLQQAATCADVVLTSGGISAGEADHTRAVLQQLGEMHFWRLAMRPGKPLTMGLLHKAPIDNSEEFQAKLALQARTSGSRSYQNNSATKSRAVVLIGLPGNPVAAMVSFLMLLRPALLGLMGVAPTSQCQPLTVQAICTQAIRKRPGRTEYQRVVLFTDEQGRSAVRSTGEQGSGLLHSMVQANALMLLEHERADIGAGETVAVLPLQGLL